MPGRAVTVVGAGVVGLSTAHELARAGERVTVVLDLAAAQTVSAVAAAIWFPYGTDHSPQVQQWGAVTLARLSDLAGDPATGVDLRAGVVVERRADTDRSWTAAVAGVEALPPDELPAGATAALRTTVPVVSMATYLGWLTAACTALGVGFRRQRVTTLADVVDGADLVVVTAGLRSGELLRDPTGFPVRGQVVRLRNPGLREWLLDEEHPDGLTYVVPRRDDVVCGGVAQVGDSRTDHDADTEAAVLRRVTALVPALAGQPVLSRAVGLRPGRPSVRLERVTGLPVPVVACYGHGGSGVTLSWGCAEAVVRLSGA